MAAARAWWMFRVFGHKDVAVLMADFPNGWRKTVRRAIPRQSTPRHFTARINNMLVRDRPDA